jgi:hypothetical protein
MNRSNNVYEEFEYYCDYCKCNCDGFGELIPPKMEGFPHTHVACKNKVVHRRKDWKKYVRTEAQTVSRGGKPHPTPPGRPDGAL